MLVGVTHNEVAASRGQCQTIVAGRRRTWRVSRVQRAQAVLDATVVGDACLVPVSSRGALSYQLLFHCG